VSRCREGSSLILTLVVLIVLDCVILGTLHMAVLEHRVSVNAGDALRLRLAARSAASTALLPWPVALDSVVPGTPLMLGAALTPDGVAVRTTAELLAGTLVFVRSEAWLPATGDGRAVAALLAVPPVLPRGLHAADALDRILGAAGQLRLRAGVTVLEPGDVIDGDLSGVVIAPGGVGLGGHTIRGVLVVDGDVSHTGGGRVLGALLARGPPPHGLQLELNEEVARTAVAAAGLDRAAPVRGRPAPPAF
jgi:hypothetical protein